MSAPARLRVAYIAQNDVLPPDDGAKIRNAHLIRGLARDHDVTLVLTSPQSAEELEGLAGLGVTPVAVPKPRRRFLSYVRRMATGVPFDLALFANPSLTRWLRRRRDHFDVILAVNVAQSMNVPRWGRAGGPALVVDTVDIEHLRQEREVRDQTNPASRLRKFARGFGMRRFELGQLRRAQQALVCSETERDLLAGEGVTNVTVVPNGVDTAVASPERRTTNGTPSRTVLFPGNLAYPPNENAATWIFREIAPRVKELDPELELLVAGRDASSRLRSMARDSPAGLESPVPDMGDYFARAAVVVAPLRTGGGTRIKILEAFGFERAVVSTRIGAEGLSVVDGEHLVLAEGTEEIARAIVRVAGDAELRERLGRAGRGLVEERYDWSAIGGRLSRDLPRWTTRDEEPA
jgi:glycosyltransferase involved in cell wall biosynthesis